MEGWLPFISRNPLHFLRGVGLNGKDVTQHNCKRIVETGNDHKGFGALMETGEGVISSISSRSPESGQVHVVTQPSRLDSGASLWRSKRSGLAVLASHNHDQASVFRGVGSGLQLLVRVLTLAVGKAHLSAGDKGHKAFDDSPISIGGVGALT